MLVCDYYYRDIQTGKSIISGTFSSINSSRFPTYHGNCAIYIALTDVAVDSEAQIVFRKEGGDFSKAMMPPLEVKASDNRRAVVEIGGNITVLELPEEGEYEFVLVWNGMEIAHRRFVAMQIGAVNGPEGPLDDEYNFL
jgi:hypothetical protein